MYGRLWIFKIDIDNIFHNIYQITIYHNTTVIAIETTIKNSLDFLGFFNEKHKAYTQKDYIKTRRGRQRHFAAEKSRQLWQNIRQGRTDSFAFSFPQEMKIKVSMRSSPHQATVHRTAPIIQQTDSLACGRATAVASVHRTLAKCRLSNPSSKYPNAQKDQSKRIGLFVACVV